MSHFDNHDAHVCNDPHCSCRHDHAEHNHTESASQLIKDSMVLARTWSIRPRLPIPCASIEEQLKRSFLELGDMLAVSGVILGHIKGTLKSESGSFLSVSVTRQGQADFTSSGHWDMEGNIAAFSLTVNILSVRKIELDLDRTFNSLIGL